MNYLPLSNILAADDDLIEEPGEVEIEGEVCSSFDKRK